MSVDELPKYAENESTNQENFEGFSSITSDMKRLNTNPKHNKKHFRNNQGKSNN